MNGEIRASISAVAAAVMLVGCASRGPVSPAAADASAQDETSAEYQRLVDNASEQIVCRRQAVTGSRIAGQVCLTRAQMKAESERAAEAMRDMQRSAATRQQIPDRPPAPPASMPRTP